MSASNFGRQAGLFAKHVIPAAIKPFHSLWHKEGVSAGNLGRQAGQFAKHVIPATIKPVHSLWHEVLGFFFLAFAGFGVFKIVHNASTMGPLRISILAIFIVVMIIYGVSSFLKARKISRS